jgi:hypothetical protein
MAKGSFKIQGTKDFLVAAVFCGFLCLWSIRDAWFPTEKILKKHPREIEVSFKVGGVVKEIHVKPDDEIHGKVVLASLYDDGFRSKVAAAEKAFEAAKAAKDPSVEEKRVAWENARTELEGCTVRNTDIMTKTSHGDEALRGTVVRIVAVPSNHVDAGAPVLTVRPVDTFYAFNKTLAILTLIGTIVSLVFHRIATR